VVDGKVVEIALDKIGLTLNANVVADDPLPPFRPSGIRLGTPALTTRGLREEHMAQIADWMKRAINARDDDVTLALLREDVTEFSISFPLPSDD
jgi:glycine hydroxymethyltransferase